MQDLSWDDLRFVLAVGRFETIAEAARRLGVDEATVARRISRMERRLEAQLFERARGRLFATDIGRLAVERAEHVERELEALTAAISGADRMATGRVRLTSVPIVVNWVLIPALPHLLSRHPELQLDLIAEPRGLSLTKRETDIALRLARPQRELRILARRVGYLGYAVYGSEGRPGNELPWITYDDLMADLPQAQWIDEQLKSGGDARPVLRVNDAESLLSAVRQGIGKSLLPKAIGDAAPGLSRLDDPSPPLSREIWLLVHPELRDLRRIAVVADWIAETIASFQ